MPDGLDLSRPFLQLLNLLLAVRDQRNELPDRIDDVVGIEVATLAEAKVHGFNQPALNFRT